MSSDNQHLVDVFSAMLDLDLEIIIDADYLVLHDTLVDYFIEEIFVVIDRGSSTYALIRFNRTPECSPQLKLQQYLESPSSLVWKSFAASMGRVAPLRETNSSVLPEENSSRSIQTGASFDRF